MVPQPRKQNPQRQPLTVALRKICRDYPAGSGILKELLQNADDAGASTVKFVLDTNSHPESPVLVDGLSHYQGPALLAYNDALFQDKDFHSLTSLGDSKKVHDKAATGKFGLGFSSVFNWTDSPSVLSGSTLLFLDPHHSWSRGFDPPGGPDYEFTSWAKDEAMINQLDCFSLLNTEWEQPLHGTIIRIPLRNASQAERSEISKKETTEEDVQNAIESFGEEMGSNGLLFLKSIRRIVLCIDNEQLSEVEVTSKYDLTGPQQRLVTMLTKCINDEDQAGGEIYHEVQLRHKVAGQETLKTFGILNLVGASIQDDSLKSWAAAEKLFPCVAVAAPTQSESSCELGRLFSTLPLPCSTGLPVHINGLFSISTDRSRLHGLDDTGVQDHRPKEWNQGIFDRLIPTAWARLLFKISQAHSAYDHSHLWPRAVMDQVAQDHLPVWFTEVGYVALEEGLLAPAETHLSMRTAFREAKLPIIFAVRHVFDEACQITGSRTLNSRSLYDSLQTMGNMDNLSSSSRLLLLEYLLYEIPLDDLGALEIFPFLDGSFRSLKLRAVFLHRNDLEETLFAQQQHATINTDRLSEIAAKFMHERAKQNVQLVRYRDPEDLRDYYLQHIANEADDTIVLDEDRRFMVDRVWEWILQHGQDDLHLAALGSLWLVPLRGSKIRRLVPVDISNIVTWFRPGEVNDTSLKVFDLNPEDAPKVLADDGLNDKVSQRLHAVANDEHSLCIKDGNKFENFLGFVAHAKGLLQTAPEDVKNSVLRMLKQHPSSERECTILKSLCLFKAIQWPADAADMSLTKYWTDLSSSVAFIGLRKLVPVPPSTKQVFIDVTDEAECALFEASGVLRCLTEIQILDEIVVPAMQSGSYDYISPSFRLEVVNLLFQNYYHVSATTRTCLESLPVVPLENGRDGGSSAFGCPTDVLDPQQHTLRDLFFQEEIVLPEQRFYKRFSAVLGECGMVKVLTPRVVLERIQSYGRKELEFDVVASRARALLQLPFPGAGEQSDDLIRVARQTKWLPARWLNESNSFTSSTESRDSCDQPYVGHVWHVLPFQVHKSWRPVLDWENHIAVDVLMAQLGASICAFDTRSVEQTLSYLCKHHTVEEYVNQLLKLSFVRSSHGQLVDAHKVCRRGSEGLMPYLYEVDPRFWNDHEQIMKLANIAELPDLQQLKNVQGALDFTSALDEGDLDVAIEVARIWGRHFHDSIDGLKVPNDKCMLVDVRGMVFNDTPWSSEGKCDFVHPRVSRTTAEQLMIEPYSERLKNGNLGITDPDDDEFYQREEVADGIRDTLDRYTRESTFHEYLANADDCASASEVNFFVDETSYGRKRLLTKDLQDLQGPSLLIHNNGVFTDADFEGLKRVGRGSKRDDPTAIGKFGRGSQTMYHWTDVPMILSGDHLLILDPLRKHLPFSFRARQRKAGILVKYANLKSLFPDQLAPFEGLWGFDSNQNFYNGTIFRFPLRKEGHGSELLESRRCPDASTTIQIFRKIFDEARLALVFLRNLTTIDFRTQHSVDFEWRVQRGTWPQSGAFSDWAHVMVEQQNSLGRVTSTTERWWRVIVDVDDAPADLQCRHKRRMKYVECGVAAPIPAEGKATGSSLQPLKSRFFNCLPLKFESTLPVHLHATFLLSGDRQNIATDENSKDAGSEWNKWLLEKKLPNVYLLFLEDIGRKVGHDVYSYFPTGVSEQHLLSDLVRASFWEEIKSSSCRLFPVIEAPQDLAKPNTNGRRHRAAPNLVTFKGAVFDVLEKRKSNALRSLLCNCLENLVCPPWQFNKYIKPVTGAQVLAPAVVRGVLRSTKAKEHVEKASQMDKDFLSILLSFIMPTTTAEVAELDDCRVLPLANGKLGTLSLESWNKEAGIRDMYFVANTECHGLFPFASSLFSAKESHEKFVEKVLSSGLFNLKTLQKGHISVVLGCKRSWAPETIFTAWLLHLWEYMNSTVESKGEPTNSGSLDLHSIKHFPLLLIRHFDGTETLESLNYMDDNPVAVRSTIEEHQNLFADFPGLGVVDSRTLPESIRQAEGSLYDVASIKRFMKSITLLAARSTMSLTAFVRVKVKETNIKTLQTVLWNISREVVSSYQLPDSVQDLPVWPRISSENGYLTAKEALVAQNRAFVVPWINDYHRFSRLESIPQRSSIDDLEMLQNVLRTIPEFIDEKNKAAYARLIRAIVFSSTLKTRISKRNKAQRFVVPLNTKRLAARLDSKLCLASDVFDHTDTIFIAAFRLEVSSRFLMTEVQDHLYFWYELGLRRRDYSKFTGPDYLACLYALEGRLASVHDQSLASDTDTVLGPLCTSDGSLSELDHMEWSTIAGLAIFPVSPVAENAPEYRRRQMDLLASQRVTLTLKEIVRRENFEVCWSQTPFALHEPSTNSIQKINLTGQPACAMVWQHLKFLAKLAQSLNGADVASFIEDLRRTYEFLQLNLQASRSTFSEPGAAIWLNAETMNSHEVSLVVLKSSWTSLENLLLDSPCDAPPLMTVQSFLGRFSTLLKEIGCKSLYYPHVMAPVSIHRRTMFDVVRKLLEEDVLTDVIFEAEACTKSAHKIILASRSLYCMKQFHGPWAPEAERNHTSKVIKLEDMTYATLKILIEFCYNETHDWAVGMRVSEDDSLQVIAEKLDCLLDVLVAADRWVMPDLLDDAQRHVIAGIRFFVRPDNVELVNKVASDAKATELMGYCQEYIVRNAEAIMLAN